VRAQALKAGSSSREGVSRLVGFASSNVEFVEHAFKQDTVGLQTKEQFAEKARARAREARQRRATVEAGAWLWRH
jgi:protein FAM50